MGAGGWHARSEGYPGARSFAPGACAHLVQGSRGGASVRPTIAQPVRDRRTIPVVSGEVYIAHTPDRDDTGEHLGRRSRIGKRTGGLLGGPLGRSEASIRISITSRITDHRPAGPDSRNGWTHRDITLDPTASPPGYPGGDRVSGAIAFPVAIVSSGGDRVFRAGPARGGIKRLRSVPEDP